MSQKKNYLLFTIHYYSLSWGKPLPLNKLLKTLKLALDRSKMFYKEKCNEQAVHSLSLHSLPVLRTDEGPT